MFFNTRKHAASSPLRQAAQEAAADLPALLLAAERAAAHVQFGQHRQRKAGNGERFWQFRPYESHDRPQDIDWRQSGKGDKIYIRQREWQTPQTALFWCSSGPGMDFHSAPTLPTKAQAAHILCLALAMLMTRAGEQIGTLGQAQRGRSDLAVERLAENLLLPETPEDLPTQIASAFPRFTTLVLCGDFLSPIAEIENSLLTLAPAESPITLLQILDPAEISLPYEGRAFFETPDHAARTHIANIDSIRAAYQERIAAHCGALHQFCTQRRWRYLLHRTDMPAEGTLHRLWLMLSGQEGPMP